MTLRGNTPLLLVHLRRLRSRSRTPYTRQVLMEAERRAKLYDAFLAAARVMDGPKLRLLVEAADYIPHNEVIP